MYGQRPVDQQQRTKERSEEELEAEKRNIKEELGKLSDFWVGGGM